MMPRLLRIVKRAIAVASWTCKEMPTKEQEENSICQ